MTCGAVEFKVQRRVYVDMSRQEKSFPTDNKTIWGLLALKNGGRSVFLDTSSRFIVRGFYHGRGSEILNLSPAKMAVLKVTRSFFSPNTLFVSFQQKATVTKVD